MKELVRIKSFPNGLIILLDEQASLERLLSETATKFKEGRAFFGRAAVAIKFSGRMLSEEEENLFLDCIESSCNLHVVCIVSKDEEQEKLFGRAIALMESMRLSETRIGNEIQIFRGSLEDGEELDTPNSIVILGDVEHGCSVTSEKSILVLGSLYGKASAGKGDGKRNSIIAALEMASDDISIGDFKYIPPKKSRWGKKQTEKALTARILENAIVMEKFTKEHLKDF